ncbi:MAG: cytochrome c biogenesis protein CcsA [Microthrixaceae bacterium]|nr:cytochrome c biogenesis protein CcsA [Microthrixaceae bacterium]MCO5313525.1 cytochrome c biogenesis protein CcsA [Microthrixaceae bacterium]HPB45442.1 cytochrome c biogenesis protein CcsA [Microthrixaceae bacterium]
MNDSPQSTSSRGSRILGILAAISALFLVLYAFWFSKADVELGNTVRILYLHVPTVIVAYLCMVANLVASVFYLWKRSEFADQLAAATGEIGMVFLGVTVITGMFWGKPTWGTYWSWGDARLTSTLLLFLLYVGYVVVRNIPAELGQRNVRSAVVGIVAALMIYPVRMSTEWFSTLHQGRTVGAPGASKISGNQEFALYLGFLTFALFAVWLTMHRFRVGWLADRAAESDLESAIEARRAEGRAEFGKVNP